MAQSKLKQMKNEAIERLAEKAFNAAREYEVASASTYPTFQDYWKTVKAGYTAANKGVGTKWKRELLSDFIAEIKNEFKDENWGYLDFIAERVLKSPSPSDHIGDWYCPKCEAYLSGEQVTFEETHATCGTPVYVKSQPSPDASKEIGVDWRFEHGYATAVVDQMKLENQSSLDATKEMGINWDSLERELIEHFEWDGKEKVILNWLRSRPEFQLRQNKDEKFSTKK